MMERYLTVITRKPKEPICSGYPPSPDYVPNPEGAKQAPPQLSMYHFFGLVYPELLTRGRFLPAESSHWPVAASPTTERRTTGRIEPSDDDDDEMMRAGGEHLAPSDPAAVAYSLNQNPYLATRARASRVVPTPVPWIRGRGSSGSGTLAVGTTTARADLYRFADMLDAAPGPDTHCPSEGGEADYLRARLGTVEGLLGDHDTFPRHITWTTSWHSSEITELQAQTVVEQT
ncbi:hypothetical protein Tco_1546236 [Tanacetum coccineum]